MIAGGRQRNGQREQGIVVLDELGVPAAGDGASQFAAEAPIEAAMILGQRQDFAAGAVQQAEWATKGFGKRRSSGASARHAQLLRSPARGPVHRSPASWSLSEAPSRNGNLKTP